MCFSETREASSHPPAIQMCSMSPFFYSVLWTLVVQGEHFPLLFTGNLLSIYFETQVWYCHLYYFNEPMHRIFKLRLVYFSIFRFSFIFLSSIFYSSVKDFVSVYFSGVPVCSMENGYNRCLKFFITTSGSSSAWQLSILLSVFLVIIVFTTFSNMSYSFIHWWKASEGWRFGSQPAKLGLELEFPLPLVYGSSKSDHCEKHLGFT